MGISGQLKKNTNNNWSNQHSFIVRQNMENPTKRQEKILSVLIQDYIKTAEPVSSKSLSKKKGFNVCPATIRNELQELTDKGYIYQPHTSAGRIPTNKAYHYFIDIVFETKDTLFSSFIFKEIEITRQQINTELKLAEDLMKSLEGIALIFNVSPMEEKDNLLEILAKIGPSRIAYDKNISLINSLIRELENLE